MTKSQLIKEYQEMGAFEFVHKISGITITTEEFVNRYASETESGVYEITQDMGFEAK